MALGVFKHCQWGANADFDRALISYRIGINLVSGPEFELGASSMGAGWAKS